MKSKDVLACGGTTSTQREVEEVLMRHPEIRQVAVFGLPHARLGEEMWAAVSTVLGVVPGPELATDLELPRRACSGFRSVGGGSRGGCGSRGPWGRSGDVADPDLLRRRRMPQILARGHLRVTG
jgi:hypothetical protein